MEEKFTITEGFPYQTAQLDETPIIYPIIKFTELRANPKVIE
jgi:hypothetical protein